MFQVFGEKNEYSPPGEWAKVLSEARPQLQISNLYYSPKTISPE